MLLCQTGIVALIDIVVVADEIHAAAVDLDAVAVTVSGSVGGEALDAAADPTNLAVGDLQIVLTGADTEVAVLEAEVVNSNIIFK